MHELTLCRNMVEIIEQEAVLQSFQRVETVRMEIGMLSCVAPEALHLFCEVGRGPLLLFVGPVEAVARLPGPKLPFRDVPGRNLG